MKKILYTFFAFLIGGCGEKANNELEVGNATEVEETVERLAEVPDSLHGYYINSHYLYSLERTKSTRESQESSTLSMVEISKAGKETNFGTVWNFHEGGSDGTLTMTGGRTAVVKGADGEESLEVHINSGGKLTVRNRYSVFELVKSPANASSFEEVASLAVNSILFAGEYRLGDKKVKLKKEGKLIGIESIASFLVATDYIDAGMSFDKIYLKIKDKKQLGFGDEYGYEFRRDTLVIFKVDCLKFREDDPESCEQDSKGEIVYKLAKK